MLLQAALLAATFIAGPSRPNIVYILADDLGYGDLGCYGQKYIKTPNLDRLAQDGMRFTQHYSGSPVCAPSRCVLLTGKNTGHSAIRDNYEMGGWERGSREGQLPLPANTPTLARMLKGQGYATAAIGKWGLGGPDTTGEPNRNGFDLFYGYLCQRLAHNYYPEYLWRNRTKDVLDNPYFSAHQKLQGDPNDPASYARYSGNEYAEDKMASEALGFIRANKDRPFFLYAPFPVPHAALQVPEDSLAPYLGVLEDKPYTGDKSYLPHRAPHAAYAAMISRMDRHIGQILALLTELNLERNTLVIFSSDNGATFNGGTDTPFFKSNGNLRGLKTQLFEGGIRVPMIARWPGRIRPGSTSDLPSAFWDIVPTFADIVGCKPLPDTDGVSLMPTLLGQPGQKRHESLYWEYHSGGGWQAVRMGDWKGIRRNAHKNPDGPIELFNLATDVSETTDVASEHPEIVRRIASLMKSSRVPSFVEQWNFPPR
ncbi:MAG: arylsulfatase [Fimbriimonadaceae bacterium]|nr:arylsulfatase [Fimbriimonadaceae bacterium]